MKRIYVSTVGRGKQKEESSKVYCIDYDSGDILNSVRLPLSMFDLANPRGGCRGARGLAYLNGSLYAAGFDGIFQIDLDTMFINKGWWTKNGNGIHQLYNKNDDYLYYVATRSNSIWGFNPNIGVFWEIKDLTLLHSGIDRPQENGCNDRVHFNSMCEKYALFSEVGAIVDYKDKNIPIEDKKYHGSHDLIRISNNEIAMNHSRQRRTIVFNTDTWEEREVFSLSEEPYIDGAISIPGFTRGLSFVEKSNLLLVGTAPSSIYAVNLNNNRVEKKINISDDVCESIFDVIVHPGDWNA